MNTNHLSIRRIFTAFAALSVVILSAWGVACAASSAKTASLADRVVAKTDVGSCDQISNSDWNSISNAARRLIHHVALAARAVTDKDFDRAAKQVAKAETLDSIITDTLPSRLVKTEIKEGAFVYRDEERVRPTLVPIIDTVGLSEEIGVGTGSAPKLEKPVTNPKETSKVEKAAVGTVLDTSVFHEGLYLDRSNLKRNLVLARAAMKAKKADRAAAALGAVLSSVVIEEDEIDLPVQRVKDNLRIFRTAADEGMTDERMAALQAAEDSLSTLAASLQGDDQQSVQSLIQDMKKAEQPSVTTKAADVDKTVDGWLKSLDQLQEKGIL